MRMKKVAEVLSGWIRKKVEEASAEGVILGMSGGLDSSVTAVLCKNAFPKSTLGLIMPCFSDPEDIEHVKQVAEKFDIETRKVDLSPVFLTVLETLGSKTYDRDIATANLKPRLRMLVLYYFANKLNYLVVGTGNKSELMIGYFTKYGDGGVDLLPLGDLLKTEVRALAEVLDIPKAIIEMPPSAGLWVGQTDETEIGMSYEVLDGVLKALASNDFAGCDMDKVKMVKDMVKKAGHKREKTPVAYL
nr:probable NH(3)-dependent NAD(+) synthetase [uncultured archaeon]